jgi:hypothetical protein
MSGHHGGGRQGHPDPGGPNPYPPPPPLQACWLNFNSWL